MVRMRARFGWSGKDLHRRLTWLAMLPACWIWTAPAAAQSSSGASDAAAGEQLLLVCRGFLEASAEKGSVKDDSLLGGGRKLLVALSDEPTFRKQIPAEADRNRFIADGREIVRSKNVEMIRSATKECSALVAQLVGELSKK